ncbi:hypothetical protein PIB30_001460 [Stylosanthes scabra]|uniref:Uncharacterized protein n=1 Tax=Stylosanthes scabra TaxID=79078 RepID=A0ABU6Q2H0_9FABA|nr:hypothetical protein [Stylosanthes scabra]
MHGIRNKGAPHGWIRDDDLWHKLVEFCRQEDFKKLKQVNKRNRASTMDGSHHTRGSTTVPCVGAVTNTHPETSVRPSLTQEVQSPPIDEDAVWTRIAGGRKRGRIYGMGVVPSHKYRHLFVDPDDDDTASGPPDFREQVTLLNREISQQAEAHAPMVTAVEAVCAEKMRSSGSSAAAMADMPTPSPPPPPLPHARSQSPTTA